MQHVLKKKPEMRWNSSLYLEFARWERKVQSDWIIRSLNVGKRVLRDLSKSMIFGLCWSDILEVKIEGEQATDEKGIHQKFLVHSLIW